MNWTSSTAYAGLLASAQNGKIIVSFSYNLYISSNYGTTFKSLNVTNCCTAAAISSNGSYILYSGPVNMTTLTYPLYVSSNYGSSFTVFHGLIASPYVSIITSASGQIMLVYSTGITFYVSSNYGQSFTSISNYPGNCNSMICDISCTMILCITTEYIYKSINTGLTFSQTGFPYNGGNWLTASLSSSGQYGAAIYQQANGYYNIYTSSDFGNNWDISNAPTGNAAIEWKSISISPTGTYIAAGQWVGYIYTSVQTFPVSSPTNMPSPTTSLTVNVQVNNFISGTSYAQYQSSVNAYIDTITQTIVNSTNIELKKLGNAGYLTESNIFYLTVQPASSRRLLLTSSVQVTYNIQSSMVSLSILI